MAVVIAQISDVHLGGPNEGSGERFSEAIEAINAMTRQPDLVLVTGDLTHTGSEPEWDEFRERVAPLRARWDAARGNHDRRIDAHVGHRSVDLDGLYVVLLDTSTDEFIDDDAAWLDAHLGHMATSRSQSHCITRRSRRASGGWTASGFAASTGSKRSYVDTRRYSKSCLGTCTGRSRRPGRDVW